MTGLALPFPASRSTITSLEDLFEIVEDHRRGLIGARGAHAPRQLTRREIRESERHTRFLDEQPLSHSLWRSIGLTTTTATATGNRER